MIASCLNHFYDYFLFSNVSFCYKFNFDTIICSNFLSILPNFFFKRGSKLWIIKDSYSLVIKIACHSICIADSGNSTLNNDTVITLRIVSTPRLTECTNRPDGVDPNPLFKKPGFDGKTQYVDYRVLLRATTCCG